MKSIILFLAFLINTNFSFSQTYLFNNLVKKAIVKTANGETQKVIGTYSGPYSFIFETPTDPSIKRLFTILNPGQINGPGIPWYGHIKDLGFVETEGITFQKSIYFDTNSSSDVLVFIALDYSKVIIFRNDQTIWEYSK